MIRSLPASARAFLLFAAGAASALCPRLSAAEFDQRMANFSSRTQVGADANAAFIGFAVGPGQTKTVLIRAVGPALTGFGVAGALPDPVIELFAAANPNTPILRNDNWTADTVGGANAFARVGAFALTAGSRDAAMVATLGPGSYSAIVRDVANRSGIALVEVYDVTGRARLTNLSTRAQVGTGAGVLISGLAVAPGGGSRRILARAAGRPGRGCADGQGAAPVSSPACPSSCSTCATSAMTNTTRSAPCWTSTGSAGTAPNPAPGAFHTAGCGCASRPSIRAHVRC